MPKPQQKPSGTTGFTRFTSGEGLTFHKRSFPSAKNELEKVIVDAAVTAAAKENPELAQRYGTPKQNAESDFDFTIGAAGDEYLDLAEVVGKGAFTATNGRYVIGELVDATMDLVKKKDKRYGYGRKAKVHLLLYATDWRYRFSDGVRELLSEYLSRRQHHFKTIAYLAVRGSGEDSISLLFPKPAGTPALGWQREHQLRGQAVVNLCEASATMTPDGSGIVFKIPIQDLP